MLALRASSRSCWTAALAARQGVRRGGRRRDRAARRSREASGVPADDAEAAWPKAFAAAKPGLASAAASRRPAPTRPRRRSPINLLNAAPGTSARPSASAPTPAFGKARRTPRSPSLTKAMAEGEIEVLIARQRREPGVHAARRARRSPRPSRKVPFVVSLANLPDETTALAHLVLPDTALARVVGRLLAARGRGRAHAADDGSPIARLAAPSATCCCPSAATVLGDGRGQGPAAVGRASRSS